MKHLSTAFLGGILLLTTPVLGDEPQTASKRESAESVESETTRYIVQGSSLELARQWVEEVGGTITHELGVIRAVGAELTAEQVAKGEEAEDIRLFEDRKVETETALDDDSDDSDDSDSDSDSDSDRRSNWDSDSDSDSDSNSHSDRDSRSDSRGANARSDRPLSRWELDNLYNRDYGSRDTVYPTIVRAAALHRVG